MTSHGFARWLPTRPRPRSRSRAIRLSLDVLETRITPYAVALAGANPVHEDFTEFGFRLFNQQFGSDHELASVPGVLSELRTGARDEDIANREPFFEDSPSLKHFWNHGVFYDRTLGGGLAFSLESAPARAIRILGLEGGIANLFQTDSGKAARYLGHVAHLLQDMTVPAHAHADPHYDGSEGTLPGGVISVTDYDPYHDYVDGVAFSTAGVYRIDDTYVASFTEGPSLRHITFAAPISAQDGRDLRNPSQLPVFAGDRLAGLFTENAQAADLFDTPDYVGRGTSGLFNRGRPILVDTPTALGIRQYFPAAAYSSFSQGELIGQANILVPKAVISTAELIRYFYSLTDSDAPKVDLPKLCSTDSTNPQAFPSGRIELTAAATDQVDPADATAVDSGVGKDLFMFEYAAVNPDGSLGDWQVLDQEGTGSVFTNGGGRFGMAFDGKHGASGSAGLPTEPGKVYAVRASAEDGAGNRGTSPVYFVRYGEPAVTEITVIDQSGSMDGAPLNSAIASASAALGTHDDFDRIGVVSFSSSASVLFPLTTINPGSQVREQAQQAIEGLTAGGFTSIGAGLLAAIGMLDPDPPPEDCTGQTSIVVLTDGEENTSPFIADVQGQIPKYVTVHGIALGSGADAAAVQRLARDHGGQFFAAADPDDLSGVYARVSGAVTGEQDVARLAGTITPGGRRTMPFHVDATAGGLTVGVTWPGSDLNLTVIAPDGRTFTVANPNGGRFSVGETAEFFRLPAASPGSWTAVVDAIDVPTGGERFEVFARVGSPLTAEIRTPTQTLAAGDTLPIQVRLTNGSPILGARVQAALIPPNPNAAPALSVSLFDDGTHGDETAGDGVYANAAPVGAVGGGVYTLQIKAVGGGFVRAPSQLLLITGGAPANTDPTITPVPDQTTGIGSTIGPLRFRIGDAETPAESLRLTVTSSNRKLLPKTGITITGAGADRRITLAPIPGQIGTTIVTLTLTDTGGRTSSTHFQVTVTGGAKVVSLQRFGFHAQPTRLVVGFSEGLDAARAQNPANYQLVAPGRDGRFGTRDDVRIGVSSARYDAASRTVTLHPIRRLNLHRVYQLTVIGTGAGGLTDRFGYPMDGNGDGRPGGNFVARITRATLAGPATAFRPRSAANLARPFTR